MGVSQSMFTPACARKQQTTWWASPGTVTSTTSRDSFETISRTLV
jgi:hypothetical protein